MAEDITTNEENTDPAVLDALEQATGGVEGILTEPTPIPGEETEESSAVTTESDDTTGAADSTEGGETESSETDATAGEADAGASTEAVRTEEDTTGVYSQTVTDPGEFTPKDYTFEVKTTDGKTHKISTPEDAEQFASLIDEEPGLVSAKEFLAFTRGSIKLESGLEADRSEWQKNVDAYKVTQEQVAVRDNTIAQINAGFNYMQNKSLLPPVDPKFDKPDVKWEDHADEPGIKERLELLKYMSDENEARMAAGLQPSFDPIGAYNAMQLEKTQKAATEAEQRESDTRRTRGAMVGGATPFIPSTQEKGVIVGTGGNIRSIYNEY